MALIRDSSSPEVWPGQIPLPGQIKVTHVVRSDYGPTAVTTTYRIAGAHNDVCFKEESNPKVTARDNDPVNTSWTEVKHTLKLRRCLGSSTEVVQIDYQMVPKNDSTGVLVGQFEVGVL